MSPNEHERETLPEWLPQWSPPSLREPAGYWRTKDDRVLPIATMETAHLKSAIALFIRFGYGDHEKVRELRRELARRREATS